MKNSKGNKQRLTLSKRMQQCNPTLSRIPDVVLEEGMLRHISGARAISSKQKLITQAVERFCESPSGPDAKNNLRKVRDYALIMDEADSEALERALARLKDFEKQFPKGHALAKDIASTIKHLETRLGKSLSALPRSVTMKLKKLKRELDAFLENPSGPKAESHLAKVFEIVEHLPQEQRQEAAREVAENLLAISGRSDAKSRNSLASVIRSGANPQSDIMRELAGMMQDSKLPRTLQLELNSETVLGWLNMNAQPESIPDPNIADDRSHRSIIHMVHQDRHGQLKEVRTIPKKAYERMQDQATTFPKNRFFKYAAMAAFAIAVSLTTALATYRVSKPTIQMGKSKISLSEIWIKYQKMIQPENPDVLSAKNEASAGHEGVYDLARIFAIYDYMIKKVKSEKISDDVEPREFGKTIRFGGDCKSKSVLLASIIESIKGKTILIWMPPFGVFPGHMVVGMKISNNSSDEKAKQLITLAIRDKYGDGPAPRFKEVLPSVGPEGTYLILDPIFRDMRSAYPGMTAISGDIPKEVIIDCVPGKKGVVPDL